MLVKNGSSVDFQDDKGKSPYHYASELGQDDTLEVLKKARANPDVQDKEFQKTPLHEAVENGQFNSL